MRWQSLSLGLALRGTSTITPVAAIASTCDQALLRETVNRYIAAQSTGEIRWLNKLMGPNAVYMENGETHDIKNSTLAHGMRIDHTHSLYDLTQCATFTELIVTNPADPWEIAAQIRLTDGKIAKIDRIVTSTGDWVFNTTHTLHYALLEDWGPIPIEKRDSRETIQKAADAYFDFLGNHSLSVPWGYPCTRLEGGSFTGTGSANDTCQIDIPENTTMQAPNRRYVIDETVGAVSMLLVFGGIDNAPDSHEFRIEGGKIHKVHTMTYCKKKPNCGLDPPPGSKPDQDIGW